MVEIISNPIETNFYEVFRYQCSSFWEGIFAKKDWEVVLIKREGYFFNDENIDFLSKFSVFCQEIDDVLMISRGVDSYGAEIRPVYKFNSQLTLSEMPYALPQEHCQELMTNSEDELIWGDSGSYGLYNSSFYWVMALGFESKLKPIIKEHITPFFEILETDDLFHEFKKQCFDFYKYSKTKEIEFIHKVKFNNHWIPNRFGKK